MPSLTDRVLNWFGYAPARSFNPFTPAEWAAINSGHFRFPQTTYGKNTEEEISSSFEGLISGAYAANPIVFACENRRVELFAEARFQFQRLEKGRPGELWSDDRLSFLENPFPGGTTAMLLKDMLLDADFGGNAFVLRESSTSLRRLRPDWVTLIAGNPRSDATTWDLDTQLLGIGYQPGGPLGGKQKVYIPVGQFAHFKTTHNPLARFSGMSWLLPTLRETTSDQAATTHKLRYFENAATPNLVVKFSETMTRAAADDWIKLFHKDHEGAANAFKTLFLGGGSDFGVVGANLKDIDFANVQSGGELRICADSGVPPILVGVKGGLDAATYSNYGAARRAFADLFARPAWRDLVGALTSITPVPGGSRLWYDDRDISFLQEDVKDAADIQSTQAGAIRQLIDAGFQDKSVVEAITSGDLNRLKHTGLFSVQLQPPGTTAAPKELPALPEPKPAPLLNAGEPVGEVRCGNCNRLLAELAAAPYKLRCTRCKTLNESGNLLAA